MLPDVGEVFSGKVVSTAPFGSFVEHPVGAHGLLHGHQAEVGSQVRVKVLASDDVRQRFSLELA
ncbi:S1 RNA binding domain-containing protein [Lentzea fradiae]|uniref:S1 RNA binding domain-containing protein n=1 Tax=Lentzea fradiae TaxID=200378 RepID=A0A1G8AEQ2_9PSEU|nr:S1 RNA-binding domain-containing protein [Lentzea fradiae]SDH19495.1 S1 RNA binding domain-containing protein [Lentzea fradiae]